MSRRTGRLVHMRVVIDFFIADLLIVVSKRVLMVISPARMLLPLVALIVGVSSDRHASWADDAGDSAEHAAGSFSDQVVAKAEKILSDSGLRRSGRSIQSTQVRDISRRMSSLNSKRREIKLLSESWDQADQAVRQNRQQSTRLTTQNATLSLQLAQATTTAINNRLVGLINANIARQRLLGEELSRLREIAGEKRGELSKAETDYAETVLAIRTELTTLENQIAAALTDKNVQTAIKVMHVNFGVDAAQSPGVILRPVSRRLESIEQQVFSEAIPLRVENRSMFVDVVIDGRSAPMVVDSGASLISLPAKIAADLNVAIPPDAPQLRLVTADGRSVMGRRVMLSKVRIGRFEAENVDAVVLPETLQTAQPLLGMSFLGNFKFEVDTGAKTLKLLRVGVE